MKVFRCSLSLWQLRLGHLRSLLLLSVSLSLAVVFSPTSAQTVMSQQTPAVSSANNIAALRTADDTRYRIGPGDVLSIVVRKAPALSGSVRVDQRGMIRLAMVEGEVRAACFTEGELAAEI